MKKRTSNQDDFGVIWERVLWALETPALQQLEHIRKKPQDAFHTIPNPWNGSFLIVGREATQSLWKIAERYLAAEPGRKARSSAKRFVAELRKQLAELFLKQQRKPNSTNIDRWISLSYRIVARSHEAVTHYIPCGLIHSDAVKRFEIGPVTLYHEAEFFRLYGKEVDQLREVIRDRHQAAVRRAVEKGYPEKHAATPEQSAQWGNDLTERLLEVFKRYSWYAVVSVGPSAEEVSYERALGLTRGALNVIKLLLGPYGTDRVRVAGDPTHTGQGATLSRGSDGKLNVSIETIPGDNVGVNNWDEVLNDEFKVSLGRLSRVLARCSDFDSVPPLCMRLMDAIHWYGDAVSERSPAAKIVKFVTAIERVCGTGKENNAAGESRGVTDLVTTRAAILFSVITESPFAEARKRIREVYGCRSEIVHGSVSPFDDGLLSYVVRTGEIARMVLLAALNYFDRIGLEASGNTQAGLRKHFRTLERWNDGGRPDPVQPPPA